MAIKITMEIYKFNIFAFIDNLLQNIVFKIKNIKIKIMVESSLYGGT